MTLKHTPLHDEHVALGAKMVPYAGYQMPVQYPTGITAEHQAVRTAAGLFDVSHMGEIEVHGAGALSYLQHVTTNDVARLEVGQAQYSALPTANGTLLDDLLIYRFPEHYLLVVNAANRQKDLDWLMQATASFDVELRDRSEDIALLALQGPRAEGILAQLTNDDLTNIGYYRFREGEIDGNSAIISRTGYTGEDGFELYVDAADASRMWDRILDAGEDQGIQATGLGCRDSLRLEMGYALYGNDLDEEHTALESGLGWVVKLGKGDFIGRDALAAQKEKGPDRRLIGFRLLERGFPRQGYAIHHDGMAVGAVTSGTISPSLGAGIGMGYVKTEASSPGTRVELMIRNQAVPAEVVRPPFYTEGGARK